MHRCGAGSSARKMPCGSWSRRSSRTGALPAPFLVLATQNPIEQEGTYPLPEAQLDRFMFMIAIDYPKAEEEEEILVRTTSGPGLEVAPVCTGEDVLAFGRVVDAVA